MILATSGTTSIRRHGVTPERVGARYSTVLWKMPRRPQIMCKYHGDSSMGLDCPLRASLTLHLSLFPGDDDGATCRIWQDSTNIDVRQNYTVSFWYKLSGLTSKPYNPDGRGPCPFSVTWGGFTIFAKDFDQGDASSEWKHVNSPIDLSPQSSSARLEFDLYCDPEWLGEGSVLLFIDSVAIYPSSGLVCDEAT